VESHRRRGSSTNLSGVGGFNVAAGERSKKIDFKSWCDQKTSKYIFGEESKLDEFKSEQFSHNVAKCLRY